MICRRSRLAGCWGWGKRIGVKNLASGVDVECLGCVDDRRRAIEDMAATGEASMSLRTPCDGIRGWEGKERSLCSLFSNPMTNKVGDGSDERRAVEKCQRLSGEGGPRSLSVSGVGVLWALVFGGGWRAAAAAGSAVALVWQLPFCAGVQAVLGASRCTSSRLSVGPIQA